MTAATRYRIWIEDSDLPYYCIEDGESRINTYLQDRSSPNAASTFLMHDAIAIVTELRRLGYGEARAEPPITVTY